MSSEGRTSSRQRQPSQPFSPAEFDKRRQAPGAPKPGQGTESLNNASVQHPTPDKNPAHRNTQPNSNISKDASQYSDEDNARLNRFANSSTQPTSANTSSSTQSSTSSSASSSTSTSSERSARLRELFEDIKVLSEGGDFVSLLRDVMPQIHNGQPLPTEQSRVSRETPNQKFEREQKEKSLEIIIGKTYPSPKDEDDEQKSHYPEGHEEQLLKFCRYLLMQVATKKMRDFFPEGEEELQEETFHFLAHRLCFTKEFAHRKWATRRHQSKYQAKDNVKAKAKEHQINTRKRQRGESITDDNQSGSKRRRTDSEDPPDSSALDANSGEESED